MIAMYRPVDNASR